MVKTWYARIKVQKLNNRFVVYETELLCTPVSHMEAIQKIRIVYECWFDPHDVIPNDGHECSFVCGLKRSPFHFCKFKHGFR